ncbi:hypothetical protein B0H19DRAFT_1256133 [Mycena capillaripes]|nr:hypothetical protein B0H19DRAFT_1256133 [Mycena capillaripes]
MSNSHTCLELEVFSHSLLARATLRAMNEVSMPFSTPVIGSASNNIQMMRSMKVTEYEADAALR